MAVAMARLPSRNLLRLLLKMPPRPNWVAQTGWNSARPCSWEVSRLHSGACEVLKKRDFAPAIMAMVRPRPAGFCYSPIEFDVMEA